MSTMSDPRVRSAVPLMSALVLMFAYLLVSPVSGALADRSLPLPNDPAAEAVAYYAANPAAVVAAATLQVVSVCGLLLFARAMRAQTRAARLAGLAFVAMLVSSILSVTMAGLAGDVADSTVGVLRQVGFYAGGVVHVVALGAFVLTIAQALRRAGLLGRPMLVFGRIAGVPAVLSVVSVAVYYANALLPLGRLLCMLWAVSLGVVYWRRGR